MVDPTINRLSLGYHAPFEGEAELQGGCSNQDPLFESGGAENARQGLQYFLDLNFGELESLIGKENFDCSYAWERSAWSTIDFRQV